MNQPQRAVVLSLVALLAALVTAVAVGGDGSQGWSRTHLADSGGGLPPRHITLADTGGGIPGKP